MTGAIDASGSGDAIVLAAAGKFLSTKYDAVRYGPPAPGRWLVYSTDPASNSLGGLASDFKRYNCTFTGGCLTPGTTVPASGNGLLYSLAPTLTIAATPAASVYGTSAPALTYSASGFVDGDTSATALSGTLTRTTGSLSSSGHEAAGIYSINQGSVASSLGYQLAFTGASYTIGPRPLNGHRNRAGTRSTTELPPASATLSDDQISGDSITTSALQVPRLRTLTRARAKRSTSPASACTAPTLATTASHRPRSRPLQISPRNRSSSRLPIKQKSMVRPISTLTYGVNAGGTRKFRTCCRVRSRDNPGETVAAGPYEITQGSLGNPNYSITFNNAALVITPATLTYVADPVSTFQWGPMPRFGGTVTGFVAGDTLASATTGALIFTPGTPNSARAGVFASTGSGLTADSGNYTLVQATSNATAFVIGPDSETRASGAPPEAYSGALISSTQMEGPCGQRAQGVGDSSHCEMPRHRTGSMEQLPFVVVSSGSRLPAGVTPY